MKNLTINARIAITIAFLGALLVVVGVLGIVGMAVSNQAQRDGYAVHFTSVVALGKSGTAMSRARFGLDWAMSNPHSPQLPAQLGRAKALLAESDNAWRAFRDLPKTPELQRLTDDLESKRSAVMHDGIDQLMTAIAAGDVNWMDENRARQLIGLYTAMNTSQSALEQYLNDQAQASSDHSAAMFHGLLIACVASIGLGLSIAFFSWLTLRRAIMLPLKQALNLFERIAAGELTMRVAIHSNDEMGALLRGLQVMQHKLDATVSTVRAGSDSIAASTQQIAAGNLDLSQRTEEQAASLEETASAMEQLMATVQINAGNALHASELAGRASSMAGGGRLAVGGMVEIMRMIQAGSSQMTGIISTIEGIAFQTNILALNAAVEAARAGEEGRGFAVVASEVHNLAQRSALAAKEISVLIVESGIQVQSGAVSIEQTDKTMQEIEAAIQGVAGIVAEIALASEEQNVGLRQISLAVTQMDDVTQRNAALVEESAATASSLADQAQRLNQVTAAFKVSGDLSPSLSAA